MTQANGSAAAGSPRQIVESIRRGRFGLDAQGQISHIDPTLLATFESLLSIVSEDIYSNDVHFFYELIQNAQDNTYLSNQINSLKFLLLDEDPTQSQQSEGCLCVFNNEVGFSADDVKSICDAGKSTKKMKKMEGYIGEKGIGFKSVFKISSNPHIFSNGYQIRFSDRDEHVGISYIVPHWVDHTPPIVRDHEGQTCILLPIKEGKYQQTKEALLAHEAEVSLFLSKLHQIEISVPSEGYLARYSIKNDESRVLVLSSSVNQKSETQKFWLSQHKVAVPSSVDEKKRKGVTDRTLSIAYPLEGKPTKHDVFAYLPTEMRTGLPFIINADFLMVSSRESINESAWNDWLLESLGSLLSRDIAMMIRDPNVGDGALRFIPSVSEVSKHNARFISMCEVAIDALVDEKLARDNSGEWRLPRECLSVANNFRKLFASCPNPTIEKYWLHSDLEKYKSSLQFLGTKGISKKERLSYFAHSAWVKSQKEAWLLQAYAYVLSEKLSNFDASDARSLPILRAEDGSMHSAESNRICIREDDTASVEIPEGDLFPKVHSLARALLEGLSKSQDLKRKFNAIFELPSLNEEWYFDHVLVPVLEERAKCAIMVDKKKLVEFVVQNWEELGYGSFDRGSDYTIPILLESGDIEFLNSSFDGVSVLVPRESGESWGEIFSTEELGNVKVLHDFYTALPMELFEQFCSDANVLIFPDPPRVELIGQSKLGGRFRDYDQLINQRYFNSAAYAVTGKSGDVAMLPDIFWSLGERDQPSRRTFIRYIEYLLIERIGEWDQGDFVGHYASISEDELPDPFRYYLLNHHWLRSSKGLKKPEECFVKNTNLELLLGDSVPYLLDEISDELADLLGVRVDAGADSIIDYLRSLAKSREAPSADLTVIYENIAKQEADLETVFATEELIYIPEAGAGSWKTSGEVVWEDASEISDSAISCLQKYYPDGLRSFFVGRLKVKEAVDPKSYADVWLNLQKIPVLNDKQKDLYYRVFNRLRSEISSDRDQEWLKDFKREAQIYSDQNRWASIDSDNPPFLPDDQALRKDFSGKVPFVYRFEHYSYFDLGVVSDFLDIERFSDVVSVGPVSGTGVSPGSVNSYLTWYSSWMLCYVIANRGPNGSEHLSRLIEDGRVEAIFRLREAVVPKLQLRAQIQHTDVAVMLSDRAAFCDFEQGVVYVDKRSEREDVLDQLALELAKYLSTGIGRTQDFEDSFRRYLSIRTESSYKKQRERRAGWSIRRELYAILKSIADQNQQVKRIDESAAPEKLPIETDGGAIGGQTERPQSPATHRPGHNDGADSATPGNATQSTSTRHSEYSGTEFDGVSPSSTARNRASGTNSGARSRGGQTRSKGLASSVNTARRSRLRSYVDYAGEDETSGQDGQESQEQRDQLGEQAELFVKEDLRRLGYEVKRMPAFNKGYDLETVDQVTGEMLYIEVKGDSFGWSEKGVGLSSAQYAKASSAKSSYVLAVVENLRSSPTQVFYIRNPVSRISEYRFDQGWSEASEPLAAAVEPIESQTAVESLKALTDSATCHEIIDYCERHQYPLPEVGLELLNHVGEVIFDCLELAWEEERVGVVIDQNEVEEVNKIDGSWKVASLNEISSVFELIDQVFGCERP